MVFQNQDVERKALAIMKILSDSPEPMGARIIARRLKEQGVELGERAVGYHLTQMDRRGLTQLVGRLDGRLLTEEGNKETTSALVRDRVGLAISKIQMLAFQSSFDCTKRAGSIPMNVSLFPKEKFVKALKAMESAFEAGLCVSDLVAVASEGEWLGELTVPKGKTGIATVCSIVLNGALLRAGVPMESRFGGILEMRNHKPLRFVELIQYACCSLDPSEIFIKAKMTSVREVTKNGNGKILSNFREIPTLCRPKVEEIADKLKEAGMRTLMVVGNPGDPVCEVRVEYDKTGIVVLGGLNPVAAAEEAGIEAENHAMSAVIDYQELTQFRELLK